MEIRETYEILLAELSDQASKSQDSQNFCEVVVRILGEHQRVDAIVFLIRYDQETFEAVSFYNRSYAKLDQDRYLKINRNTPMSEAIRLQSIQLWGSVEKLTREYPELITWAVIPHAIVAVPIIENGSTTAGAVFALHNEFSHDDHSELSKLFNGIAHLIYQVYQRQIIT